MDRPLARISFRSLVAAVVLCAGWAPAHAESVTSLQKKLYAHLRAGDSDAAKEVVRELAAAGTPTAYRALIRTGLVGQDYEVEKLVGGYLVQISGEPGRKLVLKELAKNSNYRTRVVLCAVAAHWAQTDAAALDALHGAMVDPSRPVAFAALAQIQKLKKWESVEPLIDALESRLRKQDRLYFDLRSTLKALTGQSFDAIADWRNFAATRNGRPPPPKRKPKRSKSSTVLYKPPTFFSVSLDSDRVLFVIDVSQSMLVRDPELPPELVSSGTGRRSGRTVAVAPKKEGEKDPPPKPPGPERERLLRVKKELVKVLNALPASTRFGVLQFSHKLSFFGGTSTLHGATPAKKSEAAAWVTGLKAYGATRTDRALQLAMSIPEIDTIYLLTDGRPRDERDGKIPMEPILDFVEHENRFRKVRIHTISFEQVKSAEMRNFVRELAKRTGGECHMLR